MSLMSILFRISLVLLVFQSCSASDESSNSKKERTSLDEFLDMFRGTPSGTAKEPKDGMLRESHRGNAGNGKPGNEFQLTVNPFRDGVPMGLQSAVKKTVAGMNIGEPSRPKTSAAVDIPSPGHSPVKGKPGKSGRPVGIPALRLTELHDGGFGRKMPEYSSINEDVLSADYHEELSNSFNYLSPPSSNNLRESVKRSPSNNDEYEDEDDTDRFNSQLFDSGHDFESLTRTKPSSGKMSQKNLAAILNDSTLLSASTVYERAVADRQARSSSSSSNAVDDTDDDFVPASGSVFRQKERNYDDYDDYEPATRVPAKAHLPSSLMISPFQRSEEKEEDAVLEDFVLIRDAPSNHANIVDNADFEEAVYKRTLEEANKQVSFDHGLQSTQIFHVLEQPVPVYSDYKDNPSSNSFSMRSLPGRTLSRRFGSTDSPNTPRSAGLMSPRGGYRYSRTASPLTDEEESLMSPRSRRSVSLAAPLSLPTDFQGGDRVLLDPTEVDTLAMKIRQSVISRRSTMMMQSVLAKEEDLEGAPEGVIDYKAKLGPGPDCLDWYLKARRQSEPDNSYFTSPYCHHNTPSMNWFEPKRATVRGPHRILIIQAVGVQFRVSGYSVLPVLLKNGLVVAFYRSIDHPHWLPVLEIHSTTQEHPFVNNAVRLAKEAKLADNGVREHYYDEYAGEVMLGRAAMELEALPEIPATVLARDWMECFMAIGWRPLPHKDHNITFPIAFSPNAGELFEHYSTRIHDYRESQLLPLDCTDYVGVGMKMITGGFVKDRVTHGYSLKHFPGLFNMDRTVNSLLLIPGGSVDWENPGTGAITGGQSSRRKLYNRLFGPLRAWLLRPFKKPTEDDILRVSNGTSGGGSSSASSSGSSSMHSSLVVGSPNSAESPSITSASSSPSPTLGMGSHGAYNPLNSSSSPSSTAGCRILHNPEVDLQNLERSFNVFQQACLAGQTNVCVVAEVFWGILIYRSCTVLTMPLNSWMKQSRSTQASFAAAEESLKHVRVRFLNTVNDLYRGRRRFSSFDQMTRQECCLAYHNISLGYVGPVGQQQPQVSSPPSRRQSINMSPIPPTSY